MNLLKKSVIMLGLVAVSSAALAQEEAKEEAPKTFTYATYFYCDVNGQERADEIFKARSAPVLDKMAKIGLGADAAKPSQGKPGRPERSERADRPTQPQRPEVSGEPRGGGQIPAAQSL